MISAHFQAYTGAFISSRATGEKNLFAQSKISGYFICRKPLQSRKMNEKWSIVVVEGRRGPRHINSLA